MRAADVAMRTLDGQRPRAPMPKVLVVTSVPPSRSSGAALVVRGRLLALRQQGVQVHLLVEGAPRGVSEPLEELCDSHEWISPRGGATKKVLRGAARVLTEGYAPRWNPATFAALKAAILRQKPDAVLLDGLSMAEHGRMLREAGYTGRIVLHEHNVEYRLLARQRAHASPGKSLELALRVRRNRRVESSLSRFCDGCIALSEDDREELQRLNPHFSVVHVPPDVDLSRYSPAAGPGEDGQLLFIGSLHWAPNLDGLQWLLREVWPRVLEGAPHAHLTVVGRAPKEALPAAPHVTFEGFVEDERPAYARARAVLVPLRFGSGVRIKILTALAMRRAVVSTRLGAEGIPLRDGEQVLLADDAHAFAEATLSLLRAPDRAEAIAEQALALCRDRYAPERTAGALVDFLLPSPKPPAGGSGGSR